MAEDPRRTADGYRLVVDLRRQALEGSPAWGEASGRVLLHATGAPAPPPALGDLAVFRAALRPLGGFRNPGRENAEKLLRRRGIHARASAGWPGAVAFASPDLAAGSWGWIRRRAAARLQHAAPGQPGAVLAALVVGDRSALTPETVESFRRAGTSHLLAISGLHLGILALLTAPVLQSLLVRVPRLPQTQPVKPISVALTLPLLAAYAGLSGLQTSTVRALVMTGLFLAGLALCRPVRPRTALLSTVLVLGLIDPRWLWDPGLQLSLAALAGLFWIGPLLEARLRPPPDPLDGLGPPPSWPSRLRRVAREQTVALACTSLAATATTAPVSALHFGEASLLGLLVNLVAVPLVGFACLALGLAGAAAELALPGMGAWPIALAGHGIRALLGLQAALIPLVDPLAWPPLGTLWGIAGSAMLLAACAFALQRPSRRRPALVLLAAGLFALAVPPALDRVSAALDGRAHLWVLDVGQGQALALRLPGQGWALVDAGGFPSSDFDVGERVVVPALRQLGCRRLWLAVSTHPHPDHLGGLPSAVRWGRPRELWLPGSFEGDGRYGPLLAEAGRVGCSVQWIPPGGFRREGRAGAIEAGWVPGSRENDRSLVLRLAWAGRAALLPGDLEASGQQKLLGSAFVRPSDLLVAPHHGAASALLPEFLNAVRPAAVLISAGGRPGLPSPRFVDAAEGAGARVLSTHSDGFLHAWLGDTGVGVSAGWAGSD